MVFTGSQVRGFLSDPLGLAVIQQHGVDLTVSEILELVPGELHPERYPGIYRDRSVNAATKPFPFWKDSLWKIPKGLYMIYFDQGCTIPTDAKANIVHRSSLARAGATLSSSEYDPGFHTDKVGAVLTVWHTLVLEQHARVAQIIYYGLKEAASAYNGQYQWERRN